MAIYVAVLEALENSEARCPVGVLMTSEAVRVLIGACVSWPWSYCVSHLSEQCFFLVALPSSPLLLLLECGLAPPSKAMAQGGSGMSSASSFFGDGECVADGLGPSFTCTKCGEECPVANLHGGLKKGQVPKNPVEKICCNTYKSLSKRWNKNPRLRTWWQEKSEEGKRAVFVEHKRTYELNGGGTAREFEVSVASSTQAVVGTARKRMLHWKPFSVWRQEPAR